MRSAALAVDILDGQAVLGCNLVHGRSPNRCSTASRVRWSWLNLRREAERLRPGTNDVVALIWVRLQEVIPEFRAIWRRTRPAFPSRLPVGTVRFLVTIPLT